MIRIFIFSLLSVVIASCNSYAIPKTNKNSALYPLIEQELKVEKKQ